MKTSEQIEVKGLNKIFGKNIYTEEELQTVYGQFIFVADQLHTSLDDFSIGDGELTHAELRWDIALEQSGTITTATGHTFMVDQTIFAKLDPESYENLKVLAEVVDYNRDTISRMGEKSASASSVADFALETMPNVTTLTRKFIEGLYVHNVRRRVQYWITEGQ